MGTRGGAGGVCLAVPRSFSIKAFASCSVGLLPMQQLYMPEPEKDLSRHFSLAKSCVFPVLILDGH